jgi:two-component system, NtrC family, response regulator
MSIKVLLADDDAALRRVIQFKLKQKGYDVVDVSDGAEALNRLKESRFDLLLTDMKMPGMTGLELLAESKSIQPDLEVILITAFADISQAVEAVKLGAQDYLTKPFEDDQLFISIEKALRFKMLRTENKQLREQLDSKKFLLNIIGISLPFKNMMGLVDKIAPTDATVLLVGESGTGKEVIAKAIHYKSSRNNQEFVGVNCAAIPKDLLESELFGHIKGAFTGAIKDKKGKFELAEGGTLLLDEISELNLELQAKLLRVIQERVVEPVGAEKKVEIDIRLLASSNVNLADLVAKGRFREDLFYRLNVIPINVPTLRERVDDISILVKEFLRKFGKHDNIEVSTDLMKSLQAHSWPGNIRELENTVERMVILRKSDKLTPDDLPSDFGSTQLRKGEEITANAFKTDVTFQEAEEKLITDALNMFAWNRTRAAKHLNIPRHVLVYRMKKYGIFYSSQDDSH